MSSLSSFFLLRQIGLIFCTNLVLAQRVDDHQADGEEDEEGEENDVALDVRVRYGRIIRRLGVNNQV